MDKHDFLQLFRDVRDVVFATVDHAGRPHARVIDVMHVEDGVLYFLTARGKDFYEQLTAMPFASIAACTKDYKGLRLEGRVEKISRDWLTLFFEKNPSMYEVYPGESVEVLEAFCMKNMAGELMDLAQTPIYHQFFVFGEDTTTLRHYHITDDCIGCGICAAGCPQKTIVEGTPYRIHVAHCLRCGWCAEKCPAQAIRKI